MVRLATVSALVLGLALASPAWASCDHILPGAADASAPPRAITAADLIELRDIGSPEAWVYAGVSPFALSPDAKMIAFVINQADIATNSYCRALVVIPAAGGTPRIIDRGGDYIILADTVRGLIEPVGGGLMVVPAWSSDGKRIGFLKRVSGVTQVWEAWADGRGARQVTASATDVGKWAWGPDDSILYTTRPDTIAVERAVDEESLSGYHYDDRVMTMNGIRPELRDKDVPERAFAIDAVSNRVRSATATESAVLASVPTYTPATKNGVVALDGRRAGIGSGDDNPQEPSRIWVIDAASKKTDCAFDACAKGVVQLWWDADGTLIFLRREGPARSQFAVYRWHVGRDAPQRLVVTDDWLQACLHQSGRLLCTAETSSRPVRIVAIDLRSGASSTLFDPNPGFSRLTLGKVERIFTRNSYGLEAWADLVLPPDYRPGQKLPMVVVQYHSRGFLRGGTGNDYPIFLLAQRGFAVLSVERPPLYGVGRPELDTWDKLINAMTQGWTERKSILGSLLDGVDRVATRGVIDPQRIGITGLSDGASTIEYALINTKRFAAAALSTCCEDPKTVMTYGGITWADWNRSVRRYPLASEDGSAFWKSMSLSLNARTIDTPILMQLADREYLGGLEAFTALREQNNPVDLYVFPDEYHMKWQPRHRLAVYERSIDWFDFWLNGRESADPAKKPAYAAWIKMRAGRRRDVAR